MHNKFSQKFYENFMKNNPGKSFRDFLKDQKLLDAESKKRFDDCYG